MSYTKLDSEITERYENFLISKFGDNYDRLKQVMKETGMMIAGGSVLAACFPDQNYEGDIDMYVNIKNAKPLRDFLATFDEDVFISKRNTDNKYAVTFLDINKIKRIVRFEFGDKDSIDMVYIRNQRSVLSVVTNFDFTCCQTWYDGEAVYTTHPELTLNKKAKVTKTFEHNYIGNTSEFQRHPKKRYNKYIEKGFEIELPTYAERPTINIANNLIYNDIYRIIFEWTMNLNNFVAGYSKDVFKLWEFKKYLPEDFETRPKLIKRNEYIFMNDNLDNEDFASLEDYKKINAYEKVKYNIRHAYLRLNDKLATLHRREIRLRQKYMDLQDTLIIEFGLDFLNKHEEYTEDIKYSKPVDIETKCSVDEDTNMPIGDFLSKSDMNIIIKIGEEYKGYNREHLLNVHLKESRRNLIDIEVTKLPTGQNVIYNDTFKFRSKHFNIFLIEDSGINIKCFNVDYPVYNVIPISAELFKDKFIS